MQIGIEDISRITHNPALDGPVKAVALFSGGLDSTLAILTIMKQGIGVQAVTFLTHFGCGISDSSSCSKKTAAAAEQFGFDVKQFHLAEKFVSIVKNPKFGHGKNMNPCMDCKILMLREAKEFMITSGADFIITGEVLGQRPMSQRRDALDIIDRETGLRGLILRPLSAKLLKPTVPEINGLVDREQLYGFGGRTRKPQMALAAEFGLIDYPSPAGGCLLTEPNFSFRLSELLGFDKNPSFDELDLLRVGRHFRLNSSCKVIVGRDHSENKSILRIAGDHSTLLSVEEHAGPVTLVTGDPTEDIIRTAASLCARYSDARDLPEVTVKVCKADDVRYIVCQAADQELIDRFRIELKDDKRIKSRKQG